MENVPFDPNRTTIAALYGMKPAPLQQLILELQSMIQGVVGESFLPRPMGDIHSTIIGLDVSTGEPSLRDVLGLVKFVAEAFRSTPVSVQYGGFDPSDRRMRSRGLSLFERTLTVDGDKVVLIGWPVLPDSLDGYIPSTHLADIRRGCERFGIRHKYHSDPGVDDPDSYMVIGEIAGGRMIDRNLLHRRASPALCRPTRVTLDDNCLSVIQYVSFALPHSTSDVWALRDALAELQR